MTRVKDAAMYKNLSSTGPSPERHALSQPRLYVLEVTPKQRSTYSEVMPIYLLIEREEHYELEGCRANKAHIELHYQLINSSSMEGNATGGEFSASYVSSLADSSGIRLTSRSFESGGFLVIDPTSLRGLGIGSYLMNEIVKWAGQWPDAKLETITLGGDEGEDDIRRRNRFYERFGIRFDYSDSQKITGTSVPMTIRELSPVPDSVFEGRLSVLTLEGFLATSLHQLNNTKLEASSLRRQLDASERALEYARERPLRWACVNWLRKLLR